VGRFDLLVVRGVHEAGDQQDGADGDEAVLAEEDAHGVGRGGVGPHLLAQPVGQLRSRGAFGGGLGHGRHQGPHGLRRTADAVQAEGRRDLPDQQVDGEEAAGAELAQAADEIAGLLAQAVALQQADHREHDGVDGDGAAVGEGTAEGREDFQRVHLAEQSGDDTGDAHHEDGVAARDESEDHHDHTE
jgi:hypothetical protein